MKQQRKGTQPGRRSAEEDAFADVLLELVRGPAAVYEPAQIVSECARFLGWMAATSVSETGEPLSLPDCVADVAQLMADGYAEAQSAMPPTKATN
jgi:hypothetical protein